MIRLEAARPVSLRGVLSRRDFLNVGSLSLLGSGLPDLCAAPAAGAAQADRDVNCILLFLHGGPSQLDTWDMKPEAPSEVRGPFAPIPTNVPGIRISEIFPRMARRAHLFSIVRSVYHDAAAVHSVGRQMLQTGRLFEEGVEHPHIGSVLAYWKGGRGDMPPHMLLSGQRRPGGQPQDRTFADLEKMQTQEAFALDNEPEKVREKYGKNRFGQSCLLARRLVERGVRFVTVNMFESVFDEVTWDTHGTAPFPGIDACRTVCGPWLDNGYTSLIEELQERGLYESTVVIATGEFGRTPWINPAGGRDHWPQCWSLLLGGGGLRGGQIVGASDSIGAYPAERPTTPADIVATLYTALGVRLTAEIPLPGGRRLPVVDSTARPIEELL